MMYDKRQSWKPLLETFSLLTRTDGAFIGAARMRGEGRVLSFADGTIAARLP